MTKFPPFFATISRAGRKAVAAGVGGALLGLAFYPAGWWLAWLAPGLLYLAVAVGGTLWQGLRRGFGFGFALFLVGLFWLSSVDSLPWIVVSLIEAVPYAVAGAFAVWLLPRLPVLLRPVVFAALFTLIGEAPRSNGSLAFPWLPVAASQTPALPLLQLVSVTGASGLCFAVFLIGGILGESAVQARRRTRAVFPLVGGALALFVALYAGGWRAMHKPDAGDPFPVAVIQGSRVVPPHFPLAPERAAILQTYRDLTNAAVTSAPVRPRLVVWPEAVVPGLLLRNSALRSQVIAVSRKNNVPLLAGIPDLTPDKRIWNSAALIDDGGVRGVYQKTHLVPGGEFYPFRPQLGGVYARYKIRSVDFSTGEPNQALLTLNDGTKLGTVICYETAFGAATAAQVRNGASLVVVLTNDTKFGTNAGAEQHSAFLPIRAAETRRYVVCAAATGVSEFVDPWGRVHSSTPRGVLTALVDTARLRNDQTPYVRFGEWLLWACAALILGALFVAQYKALTNSLLILANALKKRPRASD